MLTVWTIRIALLFFFLGWALGIRSRVAANSGAKTSDLAKYRSAGFLWVIGTVVYLIHVAAAFSEHHNWMHTEAFRHTGEVTKQYFGFEFGYGIFANYLFTLVCLVEATWWCGWPKSHLNRESRINWTINGFLAFIGFNGAVVFAGGWTRIISALGFCYLIFEFCRRDRRT